MEEVGGADLVDTYLKSVGRFPMLKIDEEHEYVRILEEGKAELKKIALGSPLAIPRVLTLGSEYQTGTREGAGRAPVTRANGKNLTKRSSCGSTTALKARWRGGTWNGQRKRSTK